MPLSTVLQSYHDESSHYSCLSLVSPILGWGSGVSCPRTLPRKNSEDPVRLEPPGFRVKHFASELRGTLSQPEVVLLSYIEKVYSSNEILNVHKNDRWIQAFMDTAVDRLKASALLGRNFFPAYFRTSPLLKHMRNIVGDFGKKFLLVLLVLV